MYKNLVNGRIMVLESWPVNININIYEGLSFELRKSVNDVVDFLSVIISYFLF